MTKGKDDLAVKFHKIYDNLPLEERKQVVLVLGNEPISWEIARNYIINNMPKSKEILEQLDKLGII